MKRSGPDQTQQKELCQKRTELYELLLYAQKKYRETGEKRYLRDVKTVQARIAACEKALQSLPPE